MTEPEERLPENAPKRDRIDMIADAYDHFQHRVMRILYGLIGFALLSSAIFTITQFQLSDRSAENKKTAATANRIAVQAASLAKQIQDSRVENIRNNCLQQNVRHDSSLVALDIQLLDALRIHIDRKKLAKEPLAKQLDGLDSLLNRAAKIHLKGDANGAQLIATQRFAAAIIDALVEKRDCAAVVKAQS